MAKISSHGGHTAAQVRMCRPGEADATWLTLTVTSDGRLLRKVTTAYRSAYGTHYSNSNNKLIARTDAGKLAAMSPESVEKYLRKVAARMGYPEIKD